MESEVVHFPGLIVVEQNVLHVMEVNPTGTLGVGYQKKIMIYINDLCNVYKDTIPVLFADHTNLFSSGLDATGIQEGVNHDLAIIKNGFKQINCH